MTWVQFERAVKLIGGMTWGTWELIVREEPNFARLAFIASILGLSELTHAFGAAIQKPKDEPRNDEMEPSS